MRYAEDSGIVSFPLLPLVLSDSSVELWVDFFRFFEVGVTRSYSSFQDLLLILPGSTAGRNMESTCNTGHLAMNLSI